MYYTGSIKEDEEQCLEKQASIYISDTHTHIYSPAHIQRKIKTQTTLHRLIWNYFSVKHQLQFLDLFLKDRHPQTRTTHLRSTSTSQNWPSTQTFT